MATAIISDVHGNAEALEAVLDDIDRRGVDRIVCLGDVVGYGPDPIRCIDLVRRRCAWAVMGNHDFGVLHEPVNFSHLAAPAVHWTRAQLDAECDPALRRQRYEFLGSMRVRVEERTPDGRVSVLAVHGSPRHPIAEYIFPQDVHAARPKLQAIFARVTHVCVVGHTHVPGVFTPHPGFVHPDDMPDGVWRFRPGEKTIVNVGSVGQPRDMDPRASYAILHADGVRFLRVPYDAAATAGKIRRIPGLHDRLGDRLLIGR